MSDADKAAVMMEVTIEAIAAHSSELGNLSTFVTTGMASLTEDSAQEYLARYSERLQRATIA